MKKTILYIVLGVILFVGCLTLAGCKNNKKVDPLVGSWDYSGYTYTFNEDGTGSYSFYGASMKFTYENKGDKISIKYETATNANEYGYRIEGDTLIIKDSFGKDVTYTKK